MTGGRDRGVAMDNLNKHASSLCQCSKTLSGVIFSGPMRSRLQWFLARRVGGKGVESGLV